MGSSCDYAAGHRVVSAEVDATAKTLESGLIKNEAPTAYGWGLLMLVCRFSESNGAVSGQAWQARRLPGAPVT
jgi:hypothetical protein